MKKSIIRHHGWRRDKLDHRDWLYAEHFGAQMGAAHEAASLPIDLRSKDSPVRDQSRASSCTGFGTTGSMQFIHPGTTFSPLFVYFFERLSDGDVGQDDGSEIRTGIKVLAQIGAALESDWPYDLSKLFVRPPQTAVNSARNHRALSYYRLTTPTDMAHCLSSGYPFVFGFTCFDEFESDEVASSGVLPMPRPNDNPVGGHCTMALGTGPAEHFAPESAIVQAGMTATDRVYLIRNSYGPNWGIKGYFIIPAEYIENAQLATDFWTIRR